MSARVLPSAPLAVTFIASGPFMQEGDLNWRFQVRFPIERFQVGKDVGKLSGECGEVKVGKDVLKKDKVFTQEG